MYEHYKNTNSYIALHSAGRVIYSNMQYLSDTFNELTTTCANIISNNTNYINLGYDYDDGYGSDGNSTDMISEIAHGLKLSDKTGRLTYISYDKKIPFMEKEMCILTVETLTNYTQNLNTIKDEWYNHNLEKAFIEISKL